MSEPLGSSSAPEQGPGVGVQGQPHRCPGCAAAQVRIFYEAPDVPVNSVILLPTRDEALAYPRGDIRLGFCPDCGFIFNTAFDPRLVEYSGRCEETQGYSPTFRTWHRKLAERLIDKHGLRGKRIVEIGCGKGEFLAMLCRLGDNRGIGFDPAYVAERGEDDERVEFVQDFYSERHAGHGGEFVCCKMTLEHIDETADFVSAVRRSLKDGPETVVFFQVPDTLRILEERAFWDIYYEHCSYFTQGSLARLFRLSGFDVLDVAREYGDQYLMIEARPRHASGPSASSPLASEEDVAQLAALVDRFANDLPRWREGWRERLARERAAGRRVVIWGSGSKGVSFLTTLGLGDEIDAVVDINPHRQGHFMPATGHAIVGPEWLRTNRPDVVVVMNPLYRDEIIEELQRQRVHPEVLTI